MSIYDNIAGGRLAENLRQHHGIADMRTDDIAEHASRPHTGELILVPHQYQPCPDRNRPQQGVHQRNIHHGHLIHNQNVRFKRVFLILLKSRAVCRDAARFQHTVYGPRRKPRRLAHPFCRPPCRRSQKNVQPLLLKIPDNRIDRRRLSRPRPSGNHQKPLAHRLFYSRPLKVIQLHSRLFFDTADAPADLALRHGIIHIQLSEHRGRIRLHVVKRRAVYLCLPFR